MRLHLAIFFMILFIGSYIGANNYTRLEKGEDSLESRQIYCEYVKSLEANRPRAGFSEDAFEQLYERLWLSGQALDGFRSKLANFTFTPPEIEEYLQYKTKTLEEFYLQKQKDLALLNSSHRDLSRRPSSKILQFKLDEEIPTSIQLIARQSFQVQKQIDSLSKTQLSEAQYLQLVLEAHSDNPELTVNYDLVLMVTWGRWQDLQVFPAWKQKDGHLIIKATRHPLLQLPYSFLPTNLIDQLQRRVIPDRFFIYESLLRIATPQRQSEPLKQASRPINQGQLLNPARQIPEDPNPQDLEPNTQISLSFTGPEELIIEGSSVLNRWVSSQHQSDQLNFVSTNHFALSALLDLSCLEDSSSAEFNVLASTSDPSDTAILTEKFLEELRNTKLRSSLSDPKLSFTKLIR